VEDWGRGARLEEEKRWRREGWKGEKMEEECQRKRKEGGFRIEEKGRGGEGFNK